MAGEADTAYGETVLEPHKINKPPFLKVIFEVRARGSISNGCKKKNGNEKTSTVKQECSDGIERECRTSI